MQMTMKSSPKSEDTVFTITEFSMLSTCSIIAPVAMVYLSMKIKFLYEKPINTIINTVSMDGVIK